MKTNRITTLIVAVMSLWYLGCYETKLDYTVNPDGSGKVLVEVKATPMMETNQANAGASLAKDVLKNSAGIDTWKDIEYKKTDDGKNFFKGTAYFSDITKVRFKNISMLDSINFYKDAQNNLILEMNSESKTEQKTSAKATLSSEEVDKFVTEQKSQFAQMKPMMGAFLGTMKTDISFQLPGKIEKVNNFKMDKSGLLRVSFNGQKLLDALDKLMANEEWWRAQALAGSDLQKGPPSGFEMNEQLFGEKGPVRASSKGKFKAFFDYATEMAAAQAAFDAMITTLGLVDESAQPAKKVENYQGGNFNNVKIVRTTLSNLSDPDYNLFGNDQSYRLSLLGELPGALLAAEKAVVTRAIADNGDDLLPTDEWSRETTYLQLSQSASHILWDVTLLVPDQTVKGIKELSGFVYASSASGAKWVDTGIKELKEGARGTSFDVTVETITQNESSQEISLKFAVSYTMIKDIQILDASGKVLNTQKYSSSDFGDGCTIGLYIDGQFPPKGSVKIEMYEDVQKLEIPFSITNVSLLGHPMK